MKVRNYVRAGALVIVAMILVLLSFISTASATSPIMTEDQIVLHVKHHAECYSLAEMTGDDYYLGLHGQAIKPYAKDYDYVAVHAIGYMLGYVKAASVLLKTETAVLAAQWHVEKCLESA